MREYRKGSLTGYDLNYHFVWVTKSFLLDLLDAGLSKYLERRNLFSEVEVLSFILKIFSLGKLHIYQFLN